MHKRHKILIILMVAVIFFGGIPVVFSAPDHACCCASCHCKILACLHVCVSPAKIERDVFSPRLVSAGALPLAPEFAYQHKAVRTVFHPPNPALADPS
ncbi:hypothetical protein BU251_07365 [Candidatus Velamenicoccus archaeovorus]|uniref:Uncharacterized protein n=1 Tax=Velamenicoccus archaeovorus TaxID=1930593 RepID=A0A410P5T1_VELA1|nr:hypothetical protein [Candidatus Velamenicoccus archaeovorus]QAT17547.1 hypothetical protein BU251_07365 [Candidatus Velamenicoccus archaeovorus]